MIEQEIIEGNELIADYMRLPNLGNRGWTSPVTASATPELHYHDSWGWLMPVVERISTIRYPEYYGSRGKTEDDGDWDDTAYLRTFGMRDKEGNYMVRFNANQLFSAPTLIEATFMAVVDILRWYNSKH